MTPRRDHLELSHDQYQCIGDFVKVKVSTERDSSRGWHGATRGTSACPTSTQDAVALGKFATDKRSDEDYQRSQETDTQSHLARPRRVGPLIVRVPG